MDSDFSVTGEWPSAEMVLPCAELDETVTFFVDQIGFSLKMISPADNPRRAVLHGYGIQLRIDCDAQTTPGSLRIALDKETKQSRKSNLLVAPNGTCVEIINKDLEVQENIQSLPFSFLPSVSDASWRLGRAGMYYRDLVPKSGNNGIAASHISIQEGGEVADKVHFHNVKFQIIYCYRGWVRVVYEDQGPAFIMSAGDCILQPPGIRHRVLEASPGLEVIEIAFPPDHETYIDEDFVLPTQSKDVDKTYHGQQFLYHEATKAVYKQLISNDLEVYGTDIEEASGGFSGVKLYRSNKNSESFVYCSNGKFSFFFMICGKAKLSSNERENIWLSEADSFLIPGGMTFSLTEISDDMKLFELYVPAS